MGLKPSRYNHFFEAEDGHVLAYNAFSNSFARVTPEKYKIIKEILENPNDYSYDTEEKEKLKSDLIKGGFLIDEVLDEIEILKMRNKIGRFSTEHLGLTIAPTLACNFRCIYCFGYKKKDTMSKEIEDALINFVEKKLEKARSFGVSWFGGEPLLKIDIIERLSEKFIELCNKLRVRFLEAGIITNGYFLTRKNAERLKRANITHAQITLDGPPEVHDKRRILKNGEGTFFKILENIKICMDIIKISIRINIDKLNIYKTDILFDLLDREKILDKVTVYYGHVRPYTDSCSTISTDCLSVEEFCFFSLNTLKKQIERGKIYKTVDYPVVYREGHCGADRLNTFLITPSGDMFKCWTETTFDRKHSIGNLLANNSEPFQLMNLARYLNWDPFKEECLNCDILPICLRGCPYTGMTIAKDKNCNPWRFYLKEMLKINYQLRLKRGLKASSNK
jgi:uncharacterized protein